MKNLLINIPKTIGVAFSGGIDSSAIAVMLKNQKKNVVLFHFNHGCEYSYEIEKHCVKFAHEHQLKIIIGGISDKKNKNQSLEQYWREERYKFLMSQNMFIITGHHLDDSVETWIWSFVNNNAKVIPIQKGNIIRPFITERKSMFINYCKLMNIEIYDDPYNDKKSVMRSIMRKEVLPAIEKINPGIYKIVKKMYINEHSRL